MARAQSLRADDLGERCSGSTRQPQIPRTLPTRSACARTAGFPQAPRLPSLPPRPACCTARRDLGPALAGGKPARAGERLQSQASSGYRGPLMTRWRRRELWLPLAAWAQRERPGGNRSGALGRLAPRFCLARRAQLQKGHGALRSWAPAMPGPVRNKHGQTQKQSPLCPSGSRPCRGRRMPCPGRAVRRGKPPGSHPACSQSVLRLLLGTPARTARHPLMAATPRSPTR